MSAICIIPARGGSVRIPRKNIKLFHGKPIIAYSIRAAIDSKVFDRVIVSTDDKQIADVSSLYGADIYIRPPCDGTKGTQEVTREVLMSLADVPTFACCLYATAPLIDVCDMRNAADLVHDGWAFAFAVGADPLRDAGQFYFGHTNAFLQSMPLIAAHTAMLPIAENRVCDINTPEDWARAEKMYEALHA